MFNFEHQKLNITVGGVGDGGGGDGVGGDGGGGGGGGGGGDGGGGGGDDGDTGHHWGHRAGYLANQVDSLYCLLTIFRSP